MVSKKVTVKNPTGLHLRPAGILCNEAMKYQSQILLLIAALASRKLLCTNRVNSNHKVT